MMIRFTIFAMLAVGCSTLCAGQPMRMQFKTIVPDFAQGEEKTEEVKAPVTFTQDEMLVLRSAADMSVDELSQLVEVYERMGNVAMVQSIGGLLLQRDPGNAIAERALQSVEGRAEVRKPGYLDQVAAEVLRGKRAADPDAVSAQARWLMTQKRTGEAIELLLALRKTSYERQAFPFLEDLAFAFFDAQRWSEAEMAFAELVNAASGAQRDRLGQYLELVKIERRIANVRASSQSPERALAEADKILADHPDHPSAISFRIESLHFAGRNEEALQLLQRLKDAASDRSFPYQRLLGHTFLLLKKWEAAKAVFAELKQDPVFASDVRKDAEHSMESADIARRGEQAVTAVSFGDWEKAESIIAELEKQHPGNVEVLSYKAGVMARMGQRDAALQLLLEKKQQLAGQNKPFVLQDTIGDVYLARKEFDKARAAYQEILDDKRSDWSMRRRALDALPVIRRTELMERGLLALVDRRLNRARAEAETLEQEFGADARELKLLRAEITLAEHKADAAVKELEALRTTTRQDTPFEANSSLASAYLRSGQWQAAMEIYRDIIAHHRAYMPGEFQQARWEMRSALPLVQPSATASVSARREQEGTVVRGDAAYTGPWWGTWRAQVFTHGDYLQMRDKLDGIAGKPVDQRFEAGLRVQNRFTNQLDGEVMLGGSGNDVIYGARFGRLLTPGLSWSAGFQGNVRSMESIPLEALDARENRVDASFGGSLAGPWNFQLDANCNWVRVEKTKLGNGVGGSLRLDYVMRTESDKRGELALGYLGEYRRFSLASGRMEAWGRLIDEETNRHGLHLSYQRSFGDWRISADGAAFYAFDEECIQYMATLGIQYAITDSTSAFANLRYDSNARTSLSDSGAWEASLGLSTAF